MSGSCWTCTRDCCSLTGCTPFFRQSLLVVEQQSRKPFSGYHNILQGPGLDALDKERHIVGTHMEEPSFIKDIPSSGLTPPQVDGSFLYFFQALLEHSGDIAGLRGAVLSKSGAMRACTTGQEIADSIPLPAGGKLNSAWSLQLSWDLRRTSWPRAYRQTASDSFEGPEVSSGNYLRSSCRSVSDK